VTLKQLGVSSAAEQVRYRAQTTYLGPNATFADARAAEEQAATDLGVGASAVGAAWEAQGVTPSWQPAC
jgi:Zn-dependent metalloprotease